MITILIAALSVLDVTMCSVLPRHGYPIAQSAFPDSSTALNAAISGTRPISTLLEYVCITEYTTLQTLPQSTGPGALQNCSEQPIETPCAADVTSSTDATETGLWMNISRVAPTSIAIPLLTSLLQYGPGLPGPPPPSSSTLISSSQPPFTPASFASLPSPSQLSDWTWPTRNTSGSVSNSTYCTPSTPPVTIPPASLPTFVYSPTPYPSSSAESSVEECTRGGRDTQSDLTIATTIPTAPFETPVAAPPLQQHSTAIVVVPVPPPAMDKRASPANALPASYLNDVFEKQVGATPDMPTLTPERTVTVDELPSATREVSAAHTRSGTPVSTSTSTTTRTSTKFIKTVLVAPPSATAGRASVHTSVVSPDARCPYPYPGIYCGTPRTTLITETKKKEDKTGSAGLATSTWWCPYPGQIC